MKELLKRLKEDKEALLVIGVAIAITLIPTFEPHVLSFLDVVFRKTKSYVMSKLEMVKGRVHKNNR